jgi:hypothetical protein
VDLLGSKHMAADPLDDRLQEGEDGAMFTYAKYGRAILAEPGAKAYQIFDSPTRATP